MIGYGGVLTESFVAISALIAASVINQGIYYAINSPAGATGGAGRAVDRVVDPLVDDGGSDQGADRDERLRQHAAVPDHPDMALLADHLRGGARGDQRMEPGQRTTGDRDEHEREQLSGEHGPVAVEREARDCLILEHRSGDDQADREEHDDANLHERG